MDQDDQGLVARVGPFAVDVPRSVGYFGGIGLAIAAGVVDPPLGVFIAAVPFVQLLNRQAAPRGARVLGQFFQGMAKPVGGDSEGTIQLSSPQKVPRPVRGAVTRQARGRGQSRR